MSSSSTPSDNIDQSIVFIGRMALNLLSVPQCRVGPIHTMLNWSYKSGRHSLPVIRPQGHRAEASSWVKWREHYNETNIETRLHCIRTTVLARNARPYTHVWFMHVSAPGTHQMVQVQRSDFVQNRRTIVRKRSAWRHAANGVSYKAIIL